MANITYGNKSLNEKDAEDFFKDLERDLVYSLKYTHMTYMKVLNTLVEEYRRMGFNFQCIRFLYEHGLRYIQTHL